MSSKKNHQKRPSGSESGRGSSGKQSQRKDSGIGEKPIGGPASLEWGKPKLDEMHTESELLKMLEVEFDKSPPKTGIENSTADAGSTTDRDISSGAGEPDATKYQEWISGEGVGKDFDEPDEENQNHQDDFEFNDKSEEPRDGEFKSRKPSNDERKSKNKPKKDCHDGGKKPHKSHRHRSAGSSAGQKSSQNDSLDFNDDYKTEFGSEGGRGDNPEVDFQESIMNSEISSGLSRAIVSLYEEQIKPENPLEYIVHELGAGIEDAESVDKITKEIADLRKKVEDLKKGNEEMAKLILELECKKAEEEALKELGSNPQDDSENWREELKKYEKDIEDATSATTNK